MPLVVTMELRDAFGRRRLRRFGTTLSDLGELQTYMNTGLVPHLAPVTDLALVRSVYSFVDGNTTFTGAADSNVDVGATFKVKLGSGKAGSLQVPGFPLSLVGPGGEIDCTQSAIATFMSEFSSGGVFRIEDGEYVSSVVSGRLDR